MSDKELTKEESLDLITNMIGQAKRNIAKGGSFYFLLWGWVVMFANLGHYILDKYDLHDQPYIVWLITFPAGIVSAIYGARQGKNTVVRSHLDRLYGLMWIAIAVAVMTLIFFTGNVETNLNAIILLFAGLGTLNSGLMLRFKPLILGGLALWVSSILAFSLPVTEQYLVGAIGIFAGYLIPGFLLKKVENA
ncbi:MAG: hypothetical protein GY816_05135 [Cytophagales bacterium]|nr:hypothetical protein [Cytophagales bacterium]